MYAVAFGNPYLYARAQFATRKATNSEIICRRSTINPYSMLSGAFEDERARLNHPSEPTNPASSELAPDV
jgi:hypothetical protein